MTEMNPNPFGEGFDLGAMLEQAQQMQSQLMAAQAELAAQSFDGTAGGVTITLSGTGEVVGASVSADAVDVADPEALSDLGDLIVAAYRAAKSTTDAVAQQTMGPLTDGLGGLGV